MHEETQLRRQICQAGAKMYQKNFVASNEGNISCRLGEGRFLCTPTGVSKGEMKPSMLAVVDEHGNQLSGKYPRTSEVFLHLEIYRLRGDVNAVCHAHSPYATAFAVAGAELPDRVMPEVEIIFGKVPLAEYDTPGQEGLARTIAPHIGDAQAAILLANHGLVTFGRTVEHAYFNMESLEKYCQIVLLAGRLGGAKQLPPEKLSQLYEIRKQRENSIE